MKINYIFFLAAMVLSLIVSSTTVYAQKQETNFEGRWDMTIDHNGSYASSWLEIKPWGYTKVGTFLHTGGYPRPLSVINIKEDYFYFSVPWESENRKLKVEGRIKGDSLQGEIHYPDGKKYNWSAVRAPELPYVKNPAWGTPIILFNGENLEGWHARGDNQWVAQSGILKSPKAGSNLISDMEFMDFKLHLEFRYPEHGNSGVYLRGRYEVQIFDSKGMAPSSDQFGSIFGFLEPNEMVAKGPGEWQTLDITLVGRRVTVEANGSIIINDQRIPAITGGALDSNEDKPGPFMLQGDHHPIEFRNIIVTPMVTGR
ncbi:3-keto-disaccharide hydrolase [Arenibacter palladensis]|uniref:3-keto-disaccharide hydrolase n=1 Tax=Arenibacter palladensis TaxID=237373 RepID=UPI0026E174AC|nr:DUF1080 domain-containing protein [Arenibacter palladensis]MDO6604128.1 DUF1080 domain-containing protein [Arenibacter palladensis]